MSEPVSSGALHEFISAVSSLASAKTEDRRYLTGTVSHTDLDGTVWVNVYGGINAMPVSRSTSSYSPGDQVSFSIENGVASMGGNVTDPAAGGSSVVHITRQVDIVENRVEVVEDVKADRVDTDKLAADVAKIDTAMIGKADVDDLTAAQADISQLQAADVTITGRLDAAEADIDDLEADHVSTTDLQAVNASITSLQAEDVTINGKLTAAEGDIDTLQANTADIGTIRANSAKVKDVTAQQITAATGYISDLTAGNVSAANIISDHAAVGSLDANYAQIDMANVNNAWITNGTIKDGAISSAMINDVSANKLTAGTINGSVINVTNLNADNITTGTINGQRIGEGSLSLDKLSDDVYTESEVDAKLSTMQQQIDGAIETWTGTEVPTLQNSPASSWTTTQLKDQHVGDVYFVVNSQSQQNGYNYRFTKTGSSYSWQLIKDSDVTNALQRLETAEGKITTFDSDISTLKTDTGTLTTKTTSLETRMSDAESDILDKVDTTTFNSLEDTVDGHTQTLSQHTTAISNKADSSTVTALTTRVNKNETDISGINTTIGELQTTVASKADGSALTTVSNKLNTVSDTVDGHTQTISSVQSTLATKADSSTVSTLTTRVSDMEQDVSGFKTTVSETYATKDSVSGIDTRLTTAESSITQQAGEIALKANAADVNTKAETTALLEVKANKATLTSEINASADTVKIDAARVNITGEAVFSAINGDTSTTKINGGKIDADTLHVKAANVDGSLTFGQVDGLQDALNQKQPSGSYATTEQLTTETNQRKAQYGTCNTTATEYPKVVECENFELAAGNMLLVKFANQNVYSSGALQLNVNNTGVKSVRVAGSVTSATNQLLWNTGAHIMFCYDGDAFQVVGEPRTWYGACGTGEATAAKQCTISGCVVCKGAKVELGMSYANTAASPTLSVLNRSDAARPIYFGRSGSGNIRPTKADGTSWLPNNTCTFTFDGASWRTQGKTYIDANSIVTGYLSADRIEAGSLTIGVMDESSQTSVLNSELDSTLSYMLGEIAAAARTASDYLHYSNGELTLGSGDSDIRSVLTNVKFAFKTDAGDIAYFGLNSDGIWQMHIATAFVDDMLRFGDYAWIKRDNGNMSIKWLGVANG